MWFVANSIRFVVENVFFESRFNSKNDVIECRNSKNSVVKSIVSFFVFGTSGSKNGGECLSSVRLVRSSRLFRFWGRGLCTTDNVGRAIRLTKGIAAACCL